MSSNILTIVYFNYHHLRERRGVITAADIKRRDRVVGVNRAFMVFRGAVLVGRVREKHASRAKICKPQRYTNCVIAFECCHPGKMNSDVTNKPCRTDHFVRWIAAIAA